MHCNNCKENIQHNPKYCSNCGQEIINSFDTRHLKKILVEGFSFDKGFSYNIKKLFLEGGKTVNRFVSGQTKPFQNPVMFFLTTLGILFLIMNLTDGLISGEFLLYHEDGTVGKINIDVRGPDSNQVRWLYFIIITLIVPFLAYVFHVFRDVSEQSFVQALFASIFLLSAINLIQSFVTLANRSIFHLINSFTGFYDSNPIGSMASAILIGSYLIFFFYSYFQKAKIKKLTMILLLFAVIVFMMVMLDQVLSTQTINND